MNLVGNKTLVGILFFALTPGLFAAERIRWTEQQANTWYAQQPWLVGANYIPADAINQLEMWQAETFNFQRIDLELGWAEALGMNTMRVFLHDLLWQQDPEGFKKRIDIFLAIAAKHHIRPLFVLFDACWDPRPHLGKQHDPVPGVHNSGWVESPSAAALMDPSEYSPLEAYVRGVVGAFANDDRILGWDIWNEPPNSQPGGPYAVQEAKNKAALVQTLLPQAFKWAREAGATQPLTSGVWEDPYITPEKLAPVSRIQVAESDILSFHGYDRPQETERKILFLRQFHRPVICTEYMARPARSTFEGALPIFQKYKVGAINWGLVRGKTNTIYPWDSWNKKYDHEPTPWFHDIFRESGDPYNQQEVAFIRDITGASMREFAKPTSEPFPIYFRKGFDYAEFMRFDQSTPPKDHLRQSNGFLTLVEGPDGGQSVVIELPVGEKPGNQSDRLTAIEISAPSFTPFTEHSSTGHSALFHVTYFPDRTEYSYQYASGSSVLFTVYPVYAKPAAVLTVTLEHTSSPLTVNIGVHDSGFNIQSAASDQVQSFGSDRWPYRLVAGGTRNTKLGYEGTGNSKGAIDETSFRATLRTGETASLILALGATEQDARNTLGTVERSRDLESAATRNSWNDYLASVPLVTPSTPIQYTIATTHEPHAISPEDLVRSELWTWRGLLTDISLSTDHCHPPTHSSPSTDHCLLPSTPLVIADLTEFVGMWGNDGIAEALSLAATNRKEIARASILNWFRYGVNAHGDGTAAWTIFPSGRNTYAAKGPERSTESVPLQGALVGQYVRMTGDQSILDEKPGGAAGNRTLWQCLVDYEGNLPKVRDANHDHLIDWTHTFETGWDDKNSPFVDAHGAPTSAINEQVDHLWSLSEMTYLAHLRGDDPSRWQREFEAVRDAVHSKLWDPATERYWDLDVSSGKLWTQGENLDAYDFLYYETDRDRIAAMMKRFDDPKKFNGALLPTLAFDTPNWGGYWRGPSWPREYAQVTLGLSRAGYGQEAFTWLARGIHTNIGPVLPENIDPKTYPWKEDISGVRIMGYTALDCVAFPDVAGMLIWGGQDLTIKADPSIGKVFVRGAKWLGDSYDATFDPGKPTRLWRNGRELPALSPARTWHATKHGDQVTFSPE